MGRLEDIIERNRKPPRRRERFELGLRSLFLLVILGLLLFTDWALSPDTDDATDTRQPPEQPRPATPGHVPGIYLR